MTVVLPSRSSRLFDQVLSWGDGSGGVLGHGDETVCALPAKVTSCEDKRVMLGS